MGIIFSGLDKSLLQRAARLLEQQAAGIQKSKTEAGSWAGARASKREFDALMRDARDLRSVVKRLAAPAKTTPSKTAQPPDVHTKAAEDRMRFALGAKVSIVRRGTGGTIEIAFGSEGELNRIYEAITAKG